MYICATVLAHVLHPPTGNVPPSSPHLQNGSWLVLWFVALEVAQDFLDGVVWEDVALPCEGAAVFHEDNAIALDEGRPDAHADVDEPAAHC